MYYYLNDQQIKKPWPNSQNTILASENGTPIHIPILNDNVLIVGKTGAGKTVFLKDYMTPLLHNNNEPYTIFFEIKDDFREYIRPQDKIITYDPNFPNVFKWNMIKEIRQSDDPNAELDKIADILFEDLLEDKRNLAWIQGAKDVFKGFNKTILYEYTNNPSNKVVISAMSNFTTHELLSHLALYPGNFGILRDYFDYDPKHTDGYQVPRKGSDIMFFLRNVLSEFKGSFLSDGNDTLHDYLNDRYGRRLFLIYDYDYRASSNMFFRYFINANISERISQRVDRSKKVLMVLDEITEIKGNIDLVTALTVGRGNNLQLILCTQSLEKLYSIVPTTNADHNFNASLPGFNTIVSFIPGDKETIDTLQKLFGSKKKQILIPPLSRYDQPMIETKDEPIVNYEDFASLSTGEFYIKIHESEPHRIQLNKGGVF